MKGRDNIIAIVSSPIGYRGWPTSGAYGMTKAAQLNLAESLYFDFKKIGINYSLKVVNFLFPFRHFNPWNFPVCAFFLRGQS